MINSFSNFITQIPQLNNQNTGLLTGIAGLLFVLMGTGGVIALIKVRPESSKISVEAAQGAVLVQSQVMEDLQEQLDRQKEQLEEQVKENKRLANRLSELERTAASVDRLQQRVEQLESERAGMTKRIKYLETENVRLEKELKVVRDTQNNGKGTHPAN